MINQNVPSVSSCFFKKQHILWRQPVILCVFFSRFSFSFFYIVFSLTSSLAVSFERAGRENLVKSQIRQKLGSGAVTVLGTVISGSLV